MKQLRFILLKSVLLVISCLVLFLFGLLPYPQTNFSGQRAFALLAQMQSLGARVPYSPSHALARDFISHQLMTNGWIVQIQSGETSGHTYFNILATRGLEEPRILLASHYDSRMRADHEQNPLNKSLSVPGANDGGSSTVVLLELARVLPLESSNGIGLVFFDLEDQGGINDWDWIIGSRGFVKSFSVQPELFILLDMVGGHDQVIQPPSNSDIDVYKKIQSVAKVLGYGKNFSNPSSAQILDDHVPFLEAGIPSVDLIDIIDARWHTSFDDLENVSQTSLQRIGDTLNAYINIHITKNGY